MNIRDIFDYNPETGHLTFKVRRGKMLEGKRAGSYDKSGYRKIHFHGRKEYEHRLVWAWVHGELPNHHIDHINRDRSDNRISNLRMTEHNQSDNNQNTKIRSDSTSGVKGVIWNIVKGKWQVRISYMKKTHCLGYYDSLLDAVSARMAGEREHHTFGVAA